MPLDNSRQGHTLLKEAIFKDNRMVLGMAKVNGTMARRATAVRRPMGTAGTVEHLSIHRLHTRTAGMRPRYVPCSLVASLALFGVPSP